MTDIEPRPPETESGTLSSRAGALFSGYLAGDSSKLAELVTLLTPILWHTARAQRVDAAAAEDVVQTSWLALVKHGESIAQPAAVLQWLIVTARREAWRVQRLASRVDANEFDGAELPAAPADGPELRVVLAADQEQLWEHIRRLPERCQQLLRVIAFADRPDYAAVAAAMGMPIGSIGPTRGRCLAKLRLQLVNDPAWER